MRYIMAVMACIDCHCESNMRQSRFCTFAAGIEKSAKI